MNAHLPGPLISENEGKNLTDLHQKYYPKYDHSHPSNEYFYMPRTSEELEELYKFYKSGNVKYKEFPLECIWLTILDGIREELKCRCKDGIKPLIDEYIAAISDFLRITENFGTTL